MTWPRFARGASLGYAVKNRIKGDAEPVVPPAPAAIHCDAPRRDRAARLRPRLRRASPAGRDPRSRAVHTSEKLHHRRARLLPSPPGRGRHGRAGGDQRPGIDDGPRRQNARLLHQSDRFCRAARRRSSAGDRPGLERDRLRRHRRRPIAARRCRRAGRSTPMASETTDPPRRAGRRAALVRRRARRQYRADDRSPRCWTDVRELVARRAIVHVRRSLARRWIVPHRDHAQPARAGLSEAPGFQLERLASLGVIFRDGAPLPPKSNYLTRSSPKSSARWNLDPARRVELHIGTLLKWSRPRQRFFWRERRSRSLCKLFKQLWRRQWPTD